MADHTPTQGDDHAAPRSSPSENASNIVPPASSPPELVLPPSEANGQLTSAHETPADLADVQTIRDAGRVPTAIAAVTDSFGQAGALEEVPPPPYSDSYGHIEAEQDGLDTNARVADDGRVNIRINEKSHRLTRALGPVLRRQLSVSADAPQLSEFAPPPYIPPTFVGESGKPPPPPLNVVIHVVGSRGDVQPFVALGKVLREQHGHRIRLATHPTFKKFVEENGLEFFSIGGDPAELMAFMVKNPGLMPGFDTLRSGDVGKRRKQIGVMIKGCWRSCIEAGDGEGPEPFANHESLWRAHAEQNGGYLEPFVADAIIANPPSFAHIHIAERLGVPLHIMFTMPWSPTQSFPHPLANIQASNADASMSNFLSYVLVDMMTWQGLGDVINKFRVHSLGLDAISRLWAPGMLARLRVPHTYCWSPALIPKPRDWSDHIHLSGFFFLNLASNYTPAPDLAEFLAAGPPPVYIGFGSIVVDDPNAMTKLIFEAVKKSGQRALVSKGWGGFGGEELGKPDEVFMLGNCPHDWLFKRVSCTVIHGGAGTVSASLLAGCPTVVVPFFGDQPFWGSMIARAGAGPEPIPHKKLTADNLSEAISQALKPESRERAQELAEKIGAEKGCENGATSFHQLLKVDDLRCTVDPKRTAVWRVKRTQIRLSALAATVLVNTGAITFSDLKLYRSREYDTDEGPWDPVSGGAGALIGTMSSMMMGIADMPVASLKAIGLHPDAARKRREKKEMQEKAKRLATNADGSSNPDSGSGSQTAPSITKTETSASQSLTVEGSTNTSATSLPLTLSTTDTTISDSSSLVNSPSAIVPPAELATSPQDHPSTPSIDSAMQDSAVTTPRLTGGSLPDPASPKLQSSMAQALQDVNGGRSRSRSTSRSRAGFRDRSHSRSNSNCPGSPIFSDHLKQRQLETAAGLGKGAGRIIGAGFRAPMDFALSISKGYHNLPKLVGDEVRPIGKVTDFNSGLQTAAKEFGFGLYDGVTGLVTSPIRGAKKEGVAGFFKGAGRGLFNIAVKPAAGAWAVPAYAFKGFYMEVQNKLGSSAQSYIITSRILEGYFAITNSTEEERQDIVRKYYHARAESKALKQRMRMFQNDDDDDKNEDNDGKGKAKAKSPEEKQKEKQSKKERRAKEKAEKASLKKKRSLAGSRKDRASKLGKTKSLQSRDSEETQATDSNISTVDSNTSTLYRESSVPAVVVDLDGSTLHEQSTRSTERSDSSTTLLSPVTSTEKRGGIRDVSEYDDSDSGDDNDALERAIRLSVAQTSAGNAQEDAMIASAIRASAAEMEKAATEDQTQEEAMKRAIEASIADSQRHLALSDAQKDTYKKQLEQALSNSLLERRHRHHRGNSHAGPSRPHTVSRRHGTDSEWDSSSGESTDSEEEQEMQRAIAVSRAAVDGRVDNSVYDPPPLYEGKGKGRAVETGDVPPTELDASSLQHPVAAGSSTPGAAAAELSAMPASPHAPKDDDDDDLRRAIAASTATHAAAPNADAASEEEALKRAIAASEASAAAAAQASTDNILSPEEEEQALKQAMEASAAQAVTADTLSPEEEEQALKRAMEASAADSAAQARSEEAAKREEDIVMAYIKKQSLAEAKHREEMLVAAGEISAVGSSTAIEGDDVAKIGNGVTKENDLVANTDGNALDASFVDAVEEQSRSGTPQAVAGAEVEKTNGGVSNPSA